MEKRLPLELQMSTFRGLQVHVGVACVCTVESCDYAPPPLCMLGLGKSGEELIRGILTFLRDDHYRPSNATWTRDLCSSFGCLVGNTRENNKVWHNMTQIASLLAVATVFVDL